MSNHLLVAGARPRSLGMAIVRAAKDVGFQVETLGMTTEDHQVDASNVEQVHEFFRDHNLIDHVVCTVGTNQEGTIEGKGWFNALAGQMHTNYLAPMIMLSSWTRTWRDQIKQGKTPTEAKHFAAVSSNSARIARADSGGYCASKAALSMGIRCAARQQARYPFSLYAYEPGWLEGTPMSEMVRQRMSPSHKPHRIPGGRGINPEVLAQVIVNNLKTTNFSLNGCIIPFDGGEQ